MNAAEFCLWLEGFLEAGQACNPQGISADLSTIILTKLKRVNEPTLDSSPEEPAKPLFPWYPPGIRCPSPPPYNPFPNEMPQRWAKDTVGDFPVGQPVQSNA